MITFIYYSAIIEFTLNKNFHINWAAAATNKHAGCLFEVDYIELALLILYLNLKIRKNTS